MDTQDRRARDEAQSPHTLIPAKPRPHRGRTVIVTLAAGALLIGVAGGLIWLARPKLEALIEMAQATATVTATTIASIPTPLPAATLAVAAPLPTAPVPATSAVRLVAAAAPIPTVTPTEIVYAEAIEAVVGVGGTEVVSEGGLPVGRLVQGALVNVIERSADGTWLHVQADGQVDGWAPAASLIVFDESRVRPREIVIIPITPTPTAAMVLLPTATPGGQAAGEPAATTKGGVELSAPAVGNLPAVRVTVDNGRLNIRSGPGADYPVITKALPGDVLGVLGRNAAGDWLQVEAPDAAGGFGWVAAEFVESSVAMETLPVSDAVNDGAMAEVQSKSETHDGGLAIPRPLLPGYAPLRAEPATGLQGKLVLQTRWGGDISVYDLETGELRLLTSGFDPAISPDGSRVTFTRDDGEIGVFVINIDGSDEHKIFGDRELLRSPKWSPDGQWIVFERGDQFIECRGIPEQCGITPKRPDGSLPEHERQPALARVNDDGGDYRDLDAEQYARVPDWNEAGIVYQSLGGLQMTQDTSDAETKLVYFDIEKQYELDPDWQPNGGRIVFQQRQAGYWDIFAVNPDGSGLTLLTQPGDLLADKFPSNVSPAWSPDGKHIVFLSNRLPNQSAGDDWGVWVMDADGGNPRQLPVELPFVYTFVAEQMVDWGP